jgi:acyl carrier protein
VRKENWHRSRQRRAVRLERITREDIVQDTVIVSKSAEKADVDISSIEPTAAGIQKWCQDYVANLLGVPPNKVSPDTEFDRFGLDSAMAVAMCLDLEERIGIEIPPALLFEYTTIGGFSAHVADAAGKAEGAST